MSKTKKILEYFLKLFLLILFFSILAMALERFQERYIEIAILLIAFLIIGIVGGYLINGIHLSQKNLVKLTKFQIKILFSYGIVATMSLLELLYLPFVVLASITLGIFIGRDK